MKQNGFTYECGKTRDGEEIYHYFGHIDKEGYWDGDGLIFWGPKDFYFGRWKKGEKIGIGFHNLKDDVLVLSTFNDWEIKGPTAYINNKNQIILYVEGEHCEYGFLIENGQKLREILIEENGFKIIKTFDLLIDFDFERPTPYFEGFKTVSLKKFGGESSKGEKWESYSHDGDLNSLASTNWGAGEVHIGYYKDYKREGFGMYDYGNDIVFGNYHDGSCSSSFEQFKYKNDPFGCVGVYHRKSNGQASGFYIDSSYTLHARKYDNGKFIDEKFYHLDLNAGKSGDDFEAKTDLDLEQLISGFTSKKPKKEIKTETISKDDEIKKPKKETDIDYEAELNKLIGLNSVKTKIKRIKAYTIKNKDSAPNLHMCFTGNPGTGKTEVARLLAGIFYKNGILPTSNLIETDRSGLVGQYIGQTGQKTHELIQSAMGGVLFIDEAYTLAAGDDSKDFGREAVAALLKDMEDYRGKLCVILAGYKGPMDKMISTNEGFKSRIQHHIDFPNYSKDELKSIASLMLKKAKYTMKEDTLNAFVDLVFSFSLCRDFANAREIRNALDQLIMIQNERTLAEMDNKEIDICDLKVYMEENHVSPKKKVDPTSVDYEAIKKTSELYDESNYRFDRDFMEEASVYLQMELENGGKAEGSGFLISKDGVIATCAHCVEGCKKIIANVNYIGRTGKRIVQSYETITVGIDHDNDVAVIKIKDLKNEPGFYALAKEGSKDLEPLSEIAMAGYPFGGNRLPIISFNEGEVQSVNPDNNGHKVVLIDLSGHGGNSGSGVISKDTGRIVGVFSGSLLQPLGNTGSVEEINYYRPIEFVWKILKEHAEK